MKTYIIRETTGYPTIKRGDQTVQVWLGDHITEEELATLQCDTQVVYICNEDSLIETYTPAVVAEPVAKPVAKQAAPATKTQPETNPAQ
jgi:hypothetical protein